MKITFDSENKSKNEYDYPKLYLDYGERARIAVIETDPEVDWVHNLRAPVVINGELQMETVRTSDGGTTQRPKMDFVGKHLCFGRPEVLMEKDKDPEACPTCASANQYDYIGASTRRFAMHVLQYHVQPNSFKVQTPFQATIVAWVFSGQRFNTLTDIKEEHGDLRAKDLLLGPCENKGFQKFDIQVGGSAVWLETEENKSLVKRLYAENRSENLTPLIGRRVSREMAAEDVAKVLTRHRQAYGGAMPEGPGATEEAAAALSLDSMLAGPSETPSAPEPQRESVTVAATPEPMPNFDLPAAASASSAPAPETPREEAKPTLDFDALLEGL